MHIYHDQKYHFLGMGKWLSATLHTSQEEHIRGNLLRVASDIFTGKGITSRILLDCCAPAGAPHSTLEHAPLHHLTLDIVKPDQKTLQYY